MLKILKGIGIGFCVMLVLIMVLSLVVVYSPMPYSYSGVGVLICMMAGVFTGGMISAVNMPGRGWLRGLICGGAMLFVLIIIGSVLSGSAIIQGGLFKGIALCIPASVAGGIFGINLK